MDVSQAKPQADDQNTNQNEATLTCGSLLGPDPLSNGTLGLKELKRIDGAYHKDNTKGTCDNDETNDLLYTSANSCNETEYFDTQSDDVVKVNSFQDGIMCNKASDDTPNLIADSSSMNAGVKITPDCKPQSISIVSNTANESSTIDISVASEDDIKVTCRLSSTPNNYSVLKTLDDTDCSMSSVDEASPILSSADTQPKTSDIHTTDQSAGPEDLHNNSNDHDKIDNSSMVYIQPHFYPNSPHDPRNQQIKYDFPKRYNPYYAQTPPPNFHKTNYPDPTLRSNYSTPSTPPPFDYPPFIESPSGYNNYSIYGQRSLTDVKKRQDLQQQITPSPQSDLCCYSTMSPNGMSDREYFVYPSIYVSNAGLISVLLRNDMSVEMTVDRTIRVVSHNHMMAVATDSRGTAASLYHPAAKIFQMSYNTDISTDTFRAKMTQGEAIFFSNGLSCFKLQDSELKPMAPIKFSDIHRDQSVNLLFSSEGYGESLVATCMQVASQAEYANLPKGGVIVRINGVKVTQSGCGDVTVVTGAKFIRLSPHNGTTRLGNRFVDIEVERDWSVKLTRGTHSFTSTKKRTMVSNGKMEAGFDENNGLKVINLQSRHPFMVEPNLIRGPGGKRMARTPPPPSNYIQSTCFTPRRRVLTNGTGSRGGGVNTC